MTGPLEFVEAAHTQAEKIAQAAKPGPWVAGSSSPNLVDDVVYGRSAWTGNLEHVGSTEYSGKHARPNADHIALPDPAAVLRRIGAERKLLAVHQPGVDPDWGGRCRTCVSDREGLYLEQWEPDECPCATVRALAEGWGWQEEQHG